MISAFPDTRPNAYLRATPIMIDGVLYTQDAHGLVIALDGETGRTIWEQPFGPDREEARGASTRGVGYWRSGDDRRILAIRGEYLFALDATTGVPVKTFGSQGRVLLRFADRQPLAGRFNDSTGALVLGNVVVVTGNTGGAGDGGNRKEAAPKTSAASTPKPASSCGRFKWCRGPASSATTLGATIRGKSPATSARGIR